MDHANQCMKKHPTTIKKQQFTLTSGFLLILLYLLMDPIKHGYEKFMSILLLITC